MKSDDARAAPTYVGSCAGPCTIDECVDGECLSTAIDCPKSEVCQDGECVPLPGEVRLPLDIKPRKCPNGIRRGTNAAVWVGLLGTSDFAITQVDSPNLELSRADGIGTAVAPTQKSFKDVATSFAGPGAPGCDCHELGRDGIVDLNMKFKTGDLVNAMQLDDLPAETTIELRLTGNLNDGTLFIASDCIWLAR